MAGKAGDDSAARGRAQASGSKRSFNDRQFDANPGTAKGPRNIRETRMWQDSVGGLRRMWNTYLANLQTSFQNMDRIQQEQLIVRMSQVVTIGTAVLCLSIFYNFLPQLLRVLSLPVVLIGSWYAGTRIVAPQMIVKFSQYLNPDNFQP